MKEKNVYPWSFQVALFEYLKPEQQEAVRPILLVLKKPAQVKLCCALLDYLERGEGNPPANGALWGSRPLQVRSRVPETSEEELDRLFPATPMA